MPMAKTHYRRVKALMQDSIAHDQRDYNKIYEHEALDG